jgi:hypothetical protein
MMTSEQIKMMLDGVKGLAMNCEVNVLVLKVLDEYRVYLAPEVRLKTRECRYNEVRDAQDITVGTDIHIYTGNPSVLGGISF